MITRSKEILVGETSRITIHRHNEQGSESVSISFDSNGNGVSVFTHHPIKQARELLAALGEVIDEGEQT